MTTTVKEEVFVLNRNATGMVETDGAISTGEGMQTIWDYPVPTGYSLVFNSDDHFAAYLVSTGTTEVGVASLIDVVISDSSRVAIRPILFTIRYDQARGSATTFLAFADKDYFNYLDIALGEPVVAAEGERVLIRANANGAIDTDGGVAYFALTCKRVRHTLFE